MEYRSVRDLNDRVIDWIGILPPDLDVVVGIPRSGMLVANLIALHMHLPFTDIEGLCDGRILASGQRGVPDPDPRQLLAVLVVDDSVCSGASMRRARARIAAAGLSHRVCYGAVFVTPEAIREAEVDTFAEAVPMPRVFEWNILHTPHLDRVCVAAEGVLCQPSSLGEAATGDEAFAAVPLFRPQHRLGWIVVPRPESSRGAVEHWLAREGIDHGRLILSDAIRDRRSLIAFKARVYRATGAELFIEGNPDHAAAIAARAGKPVFSFTTRSMVYPGHFPRFRHVPVRSPDRIEQAGKWLRRLPARIVRRLLRGVRSAIVATGLTRGQESSP